MSVCSFHVAVSRCTNSPSDMAIFQTRSSNALDVVFADTVATKERLKRYGSGYVITIPAYSAQEDVVVWIRRALRGQL